MSQRTMGLLKECLPMFSMLADENRQTILMLIFDHQKLNVNELTELLHLSRPAVSHHLKLLLQADLLNVEQVGKERYYSLNLRNSLNLLKNLTQSLENDVLELESKK